MTDLLHNARASENIIIKKMIDTFGMTGYAIFWEIVSLLHRDGKLSRLVIARKLDAEFSEINPVIRFCISENLLNISGNVDDKSEYISLIENTGIYKIEEQKM